MKQNDIKTFSRTRTRLAINERIRIQVRVKSTVIPTFELSKEAKSCDYVNTYKNTKLRRKLCISWDVTSKRRRRMLYTRLLASCPINCLWKNIYFVRQWVLDEQAHFFTWTRSGRFRNIRIWTRHTFDLWHYVIPIRHEKSWTSSRHKISIQTECSKIVPLEPRRNWFRNIWHGHLFLLDCSSISVCF